MKSMSLLRKIAVLALAALLTLSLAACGGDVSSSALMSGIRQRGLIRIGFKTDVAKFSFLDDAGNLAGFECDLAALLADALDETHLQVKVVEVNSCTAYPMLEKGEIDCLVATAAYESSRTAKVTYSEPYYTDAAALLSVKDRFASADQIVLGGGKIGYTDPDIIGQRLSSLLEKPESDFEMVSMASYPEAVEAVKNGTIDAFCAGFASLYGLADASTAILPESLGDIDYCVVLAGKKEDALAGRVSAVLQEMEKDGRLSALLQQWGIE